MADAERLRDADPTMRDPSQQRVEITMRTAEQRLAATQARCVRLYNGSRSRRAMTMEEIGQLLGISRERVRQHLKAAGVQSRPVGPRIDREMILVLGREKKLSVREIAEKADCSRECAIRKLRDEGLLEGVRKAEGGRRIEERRAELIDMLQALGKTLGGRAPTSSELRATRHTARPFIKAFGSLDAAYKAAGLKRLDK
jgi:DNA-binding CsgD family transcriptional regulator